MNGRGDGTRDRRIAVVAMGGVFPGAADPAALWRLIEDGRSAAAEPPPGRWTIPVDEAYRPGPPAPDRVYSRRQCLIASLPDDFAGLRVDPETVRGFDPAVRLALTAAKRTWERLAVPILDRTRVGAIFGNIALPTEFASRYSREILGRPVAERLGVHGWPKTRTDPRNLQAAGLPAALVADALGLGGPAFALDAACASSLYAVALAMEELRSGRADAMLTGGMALPDPLYTQMGFCQLHALSPSGRCSPFDARADGLVVGEGAGFFVLKRFADAEAAGDRILGVLHDYGLSNDVEGNLLAPSGAGQLRALRAAYIRAGWRPETVELIECHATGTPMGDRTELASLRQLWGDARSPNRCAIGSVKSNVGHLLTGAGAAGLAKVLLAFERRRLPPTAHYERPLDSSLADSPFRVLSNVEDWPDPKSGPRRAAVSAFGFGGINAHLLVEEYRSNSGGFVPLLETPNESDEAVAVVGIGERRVDASGEIGVPVGRFPIPPREFADILPQQTLMLLAVDDALADAGLRDAAPEAKLRTGAAFGIALDPNTLNFDLRWAMRELADGERRATLRDAVHPPLSADRTLGALGGIVASRIARVFKLGGPCFGVESEETSAFAALDVAVGMLRRREIDVAIVGAVDLPNDPRTRTTTAASGVDLAAAVVLKRLSDVDPTRERVYAVVDNVALGDDAERLQALELPSVPAGAASGAAMLVEACRRLEAGEWNGQPWLTDRRDGKRRVCIRGRNRFGGRGAALLDEAPPAFVSRQLRPAVVDRIIPFSADDAADLFSQVVAFRSAWTTESVEELLRRRSQTCDPTKSVRAVVNALTEDAPAALDELSACIRERRGSDGPRVFWNPTAVPSGDLAFVFPGSGNQFAEMGRDWFAAFPYLWRRRDAIDERLASQVRSAAFWGETHAPTPLDVILGQVTLGALLVELLADFGVRPQATVGYSLGESAALIATGAWTNRDEMLRRLEASPLFIHDLAGPCEAARRTWNLSDDEVVDWCAGVVNRCAADVRTALADRPRVYLLFVNAPKQCVVGGERQAVLKVVERLRCAFVEVVGASTVHCEVAKSVATAYRELHSLPTTPATNVRYYSAAFGGEYTPTDESAAEAITQLALGTVDFPRVVEQAYRDGVRTFLEIGPGASCTRMIGKILGDRPHRTLTFCTKDAEPTSTLLRTLARLFVAGHTVDWQSAAEATPTERRREKVGATIRVTAHRPPIEVPKELPDRASERSAHAPIARMESPSKGSGELEFLGNRADAARLPAIRANDELVAAWTAANTATVDAHEAFLRLQHTSAQQWQRLAETAVRPSDPRTLNGVRTHHPNPPQGGREYRADSPSQAGRESFHVPRSLAREECLAFAVGKIGDVLGQKYAEVDAFPTRVRLPDEPLMLVDRIVEIDAEPLMLIEDRLRAMAGGRLVTEHDIHAGSWYLDGGRIPTCIAVESGQADLFLSGYLGVDFVTRGLAVYRLLDAVVTFHAPLPCAGKTIRYDIHIDQFFTHADTQFFRFRFDATVDGELLLTMREGCAGFFTAEALAAGRGVVRSAMEAQPRPGKRPPDWRSLAPLVGVEAYSAERIDALRAGDLARAFGPAFVELPIRSPAGLPDGRMRLVHRVSHLDPQGGRYGLGMIRGEADIRPEDWFLVCHFVDDRVMPGTLMYECCLHTLRIFLLRLGWIAEADAVVYEPKPGVAGRLKCRGQVIESTKVVTYEVEIKELGYDPAPFAIADALMYADGRPIVEMTDMSLRLSGVAREQVEAMWHGERRSTFAAERGKPLFDRDRILAFAIGKPSEAFGDRYLPFDDERKIARLPGPPYQFLDRIVSIRNGEAWKLAAGCEIVAEYDVQPQEWYFDANRGSGMPFAVLLEIALQPCGWLAAYLGSALTSEIDLSFRNLGGRAILHETVGPNVGTLATTVKMTQVSASGGMIIQHYDFEVRTQGRMVYEGDTYFGFFSKDALANQVGIRDATLYTVPDADVRTSVPLPRTPPFPDDRLRMMDDAVLSPTGGPTGLGFVEGRKRVNPNEWFFKAHFFQDPVWPGSLGLEALLQLLSLWAADRWGAPRRFRSVAPGVEHRWVYRGQVVPADREVRVQTTVTKVDDERRTAVADGLLWVDGRTIYRMSGFSVNWNDA